MKINKLTDNIIMNIAGQDGNVQIREFISCYQH